MVTSNRETGFAIRESIELIGEQSRFAIGNEPETTSTGKQLNVVVQNTGINSVSNFQRKPFIRNGLKAEKLLEKYNNLAKEALSNGNEILSESYYQHADHFLRVIENRNSIQNNSKTDMNNSSKEKNSDDKIILKDEKDSSFQQPQNSEEI